MVRNSPNEVVPEQPEGLNEDNIYSEEAIEEDLYQDEIALYEAGFMQGYDREADSIEVDSPYAELGEEDFAQQGEMFSSELE